MKRYRSYLLIIPVLISLLVSCATSRQLNPGTRKYAPASLQKDFMIFRHILENDHPSIYWFTPKDSMNYYFDQGYKQLSDSLTETAFKDILSYIVEKIHCGHTSVQHSKRYLDYIDTARIPVFPLSLKVWSDSMAVVANLNRSDSILENGILIRSVNGIPAKSIIDSMCNFVVSDGRSYSGKYQSLSMPGSFGSLYRRLYGLTDSFDIGYSMPGGDTYFTRIPLYDPREDTLQRHSARHDSLLNKLPRKDKTRPVVLNNVRNVQIDTTLSSAYMTVNSFARGNGLRSFFKKTFRVINDHQIHHLVIDVRSNGGGDASLSTLLTKYLINERFKLADSLYTNRRSLEYSRYVKKSFFYWAASIMVTHKARDGKFHFGYFERHYFHPKQKNHYSGNVYIITGGNSFSATTLFAKSLQGQKNVIIIGEETGGGGYGNTAWMIPEVKLPNTRLRFRLPRFRLVMDTTAVAAGRGVMPDITISASSASIHFGVDPKAAVVREIIQRRNALSRQ